MITAITNVRLFDGERVTESTDVVVDGRQVRSVGEAVPAGADVVDGRGRTLLPGLIDSHVHTAPESLALALRFGVTTELEMQGVNTRFRRGVIEEDDTLADVRSSGFAITPPGGHPSELFPADARPGADGEAAEDHHEHTDAPLMPFSSTPEEAERFVPELVASGSDYIKFMIDDGTVEGHPGLPALDQATLDAGVAAARRLGMLTVAHALTLEATAMGLDAGIHGFAHVFMDRPHTADIVRRIADAGAFVVPCIVLNASMMGRSASGFAADERVRTKLPASWRQAMEGTYGRFPQGDLDDVLGTVRALHEAGVDLLIGTDASVPVPFLGGVAHGASVHHELQFFVAAGLEPVDALRAATSVPARRFGLHDRGRVAPGLRADLVLVDGDPTTSIGDTLSIRSVWRRGTRVDLT